MQILYDTYAIFCDKIVHTLLSSITWSRPANTSEMPRWGDETGFVLNNVGSELRRAEAAPATYLREVYHSERNEAAWDRQSNDQAVPGRAATFRTTKS